MKYGLLDTDFEVPWFCLLTVCQQVADNTPSRQQFLEITDRQNWP